MKKQKKNLIITVLIIALSLLGTKIKAKNKVIYPLEYPVENANFIKRNFKPGKIKTINAKTLKKILPGMWNLTPPDLVYFKKEGTFHVVDYSNNYESSYEGEWKAKDNAIAFKVEGAKKWQICKILYVEYNTCMPKCAKGSSDRYTISITTEEIYFKTEWRKAIFLEGGFAVGFN